MRKDFCELFLSRWQKFFDAAELPLGFFYSDDPAGAAAPSSASNHHCLICELGRVRRGERLAFSAENVQCAGGRRHLGFAPDIRPGFEYFLSCGIPGKMAGERYSKSPELVKKSMARMKVLPARKKFIVFQRWDMLRPGEIPEVAVFFCQADVLSGLFTLANFPSSRGDRVIAPFSSGCGAIVHRPLREKTKRPMRAILGMFDPSARPCVSAPTLTLAMPLAMLQRMVFDMEQSFLITPTWETLRQRIQRQ